MTLSHVIVYVPDVEKALAFYEAAFGLTRRVLHESGTYGEIETGATALAFAAESLAALHEVTIRPNRPDAIAGGFELCLSSDNPRAAYDRAIAAGATRVSPVTRKPWGQDVGYVRDLNGCLVELCSPVE